MNIIIPIGGIGKRFSEAGYKLPKPLINVLGKPMIYRVIESFKLEKNVEHKIHIVYHNYLKDYNFETLINFYFPNLNISFTCIDYLTKGAAETVLIGLDSFSDEELKSSVLIADCDTFYEDHVIELYTNNESKNSIFYFEDTQEDPMFSYIEIEDGVVKNIKEKIKISNCANTGLYGFSSGELLKKYCIKILDYQKELYISHVYEEMINDGLQINAIKVEKFDCVGTPIQLKSYCNKNKDKVHELRICFDLDNTLVTHPLKKGDYTSVLPIKKNIEYLKFLKTLGATIIIYTARRMKTHSGNVGAIVADVGKITLETLEKFEIPFDEIYFGKPYANFYIDDLAINANHTLDNEIGIYNLDTTPRHFNKVEYNTHTVTKFTANDGEIYWYKNIPKSISHYFPKVISINKNSITLERIDGVNYSYLYTNKELKTKHIDELLYSLNDMHTLAIPSGNHNIYKNYYEKVNKRINENSFLYKKYELENITNFLLDKLKQYEKNNEGIVSVIHGDPVFTNIFQTPRGIKYIDMRGKQGDELTICGDSLYDYAKVYQSLLGYDNILNEIEIDTHYTNEIIKYFEEKIGKDNLKKIKIITASLLVSMLPLHTEDEEKFKKYIKIVNSLLNL